MFTSRSLCVFLCFCLCFVRASDHPMIPSHKRFTHYSYLRAAYRLRATYIASNCMLKSLQTESQTAEWPLEVLYRAVGIAVQKGGYCVLHRVHALPMSGMGVLTSHTRLSTVLIRYPKRQGAVRVRAASRSLFWFRQTSKARASPSGTSTTWSCTWFGPALVAWCSSTTSTVTHSVLSRVGLRSG